MNARDLTSTLVTADLREPIVSGRNLVWCATFPLAWNELLDVFGEDIYFKDMASQPALLTSLNEWLVTRDDLDDASYVAMAGQVEDDILGQIRETMAQKSPEAQPVLPEIKPDRKGIIVAYAYLLKNLLFPERFERITDPLDFGGTPILCFGISGKTSVDPQVLRQVKVLDYQHNDDFVIELITRSEADQIIMAKVHPEATLAATIDAVLARSVSGSSGSLTENDVLKVPMMNFRLERSFDELIDHPFDSRLLENEYVIFMARQDVRFELNEAGVRLESQATIGAMVTSAPPEPKRLVFDKPFLFLMKLRSADRPYFAMWIDTPELLGKAD